MGTGGMYCREVPRYKVGIIYTTSASPRSNPARTNGPRAPLIQYSWPATAKGQPDERTVLLRRGDSHVRRLPSARPLRPALTGSSQTTRAPQPIARPVQSGISESTVAQRRPGARTATGAPACREHRIGRGSKSNRIYCPCRSTSYEGVVL
jgi:hypothetical protein